MEKSQKRKSPPSKTYGQSKKKATAPPSSNADMNHMKAKPVVAAIDFGTTYSGYAFSFATQPNTILLNNNWGAELGANSYKTPTVVLTKPDGSFHSFGSEAEVNFSQLPYRTVIGGPNGFNLYRHFKMLLYEQAIKLNTNVTSTCGHTVRAIDIFSMALKYLHKHMMDEIAKQMTSRILPADIRLVLTVPAIWKDEAKAFMREAALRAGVISRNNSDNLLFALEPEVASIYCRSLPVNKCVIQQKRSELAFKSGIQLLVVDAGGGTVDITAHETQICGEVQEIVPPSGGPWGGNRVDDNFLSFLWTLFGKSFLCCFKKKHPKQWLKFLMSCEVCKKTVRPDSTASLHVQLPYSLESEFQMHYKMTIEDALKKMKDKVFFDSGVLIINIETAKAFFSEPINNILNHVRQVLMDERLKTLKFILLVGGFGQCRLLQDAFQKAFPESPKLVIPFEAQLAILRGAVQFGLNPTQVTSRIARFTYGTSRYEYFIDGVHDPARKVLNDEGKEYCEKLFLPYIIKGEKVRTGEQRLFNSHPFFKNQADATFQLCRTEKKSVMYANDPEVTKLGHVELRSPSGPVSENLEVRVTVGHTELLIEAREKACGSNYPVQMTVDFLSA